MMRWFILLALPAFVACGGASASNPPPAEPSADHGDHHHAAPSAEQSDGDLKAPGTATIGDKTKCPASGEEFVVEASSPKFEHEGKTYYFCCGGCKKRFEANPAKFLNET